MFATVLTTIICITTIWRPGLYNFMTEKSTKRHPKTSYINCPETYIIMQSSRYQDHECILQ